MLFRSGLAQLWHGGSNGPTVRARVEGRQLELTIGGEGGRRGTVELQTRSGVTRHEFTSVEGKPVLLSADEPVVGFVVEWRASP